MKFSYRLEQSARSSSVVNSNARRQPALFMPICLKEWERSGPLRVINAPEA